MSDNYYGTKYYGTHYYGSNATAFTPEVSSSIFFYPEYEVGSGSFGGGSFGDYSPGLQVVYTPESPQSVVYTPE